MLCFWVDQRSGSLEYGRYEGLACDIVCQRESLGLVLLPGNNDLVHAGNLARTLLRLRARCPLANAATSSSKFLSGNPKNYGLAIDNPKGGGAYTLISSNPKNHGLVIDNPDAGARILWPAVILRITVWPSITLKEGTRIL